MREGGGVWFGWNGKTSPGSLAAGPVEHVARDGVTFATTSLPEALQERCYSGYANGTLWPLFHYLLDSFRYDEDDYQAYLSVNEIFAQRVTSLIRSGDLVWVHDYHLFPLGGEL